MMENILIGSDNRNNKIRSLEISEFLQGTAEVEQD